MKNPKAIFPRKCITFLLRSYYCLDFCIKSLGSCISFCHSKVGKERDDDFNKFTSNLYYTLAYPHTVGLRTQQWSESSWHILRRDIEQDSWISKKLSISFHSWTIAMTSGINFLLSLRIRLRSRRLVRTAFSSITIRFSKTQQSISHVGSSDGGNFLLHWLIDWLLQSTFNHTLHSYMLKWISDPLKEVWWFNFNIGAITLILPNMGI